MVVAPAKLRRSSQRNRASDRAGRANFLGSRLAGVRARVQAVGAAARFPPLPRRQQPPDSTTPPPRGRGEPRAAPPGTLRAPARGTYPGSLGLPDRYVPQVHGLAGLDRELLVRQPAVLVPAGEAVGGAGDQGGEGDAALGVGLHLVPVIVPVEVRERLHVPVQRAAGRAVARVVARGTRGDDDVRRDLVVGDRLAHAVHVAGSRLAAGRQTDGHLLTGLLTGELDAGSGLLLRVQEADGDRLLRGEPVDLEP